MSANSTCTTSWERSLATAWRRAARSPRLPRVIICSANGLTAFALASVVLIRPCSISEPARFAYSALRCAESRPSFLPARWWRTAGPLERPFVAAQRQAVRGERLLDFLDRLLAEVRDVRELVLGLDHEVADRLDPHTLEAVVRANSELELLDREVLHPVRKRHLGLRAVTTAHVGQVRNAIDVGEDRELLDQDLRRLRDRVLRR